MSFKEVLQVTVKGEVDTLVLFSIISWVIAKTGDFHLLPALSVFIIYYIGLYVTCRLCDREESDNSNVLKYIFFMIMALNFYGLVNNIRNVLAFCIMGYATFRDVYDEKRNIWTLLLYVAPVFIHEAAIAMLLIRLLIGRSKKVKIASLIGVVSIKQITLLLYKYVYLFSSKNIIISVIRRFILRMYQYIMDTSSVWGTIVQNSTQERLTKIVYISMAVLFCIMCFYSFTNPKYNSNKKMIELLFNLSLFVMACTPMRMPEYWRFASAMIVFSGVLFVVVLGNKKYDKLILFFLYSLAVLAMLFWMRRTVNSDLIGLLIKPFLSSPLVVIIKDSLDIVIR